ncbi:ssDNA endodeoxyribonuclease [Arachnomyces sp. PD_36]|nr:ssDNA endodeoxyribonuclease [Arachnomyces sp. PD_36]
MEAQNGPPIFSAVSNSAHQLYILLRCISFASKAFVQITPDGIRFSVEDGRVMQGLAFLDKALFTNYIFNPPPSTSNNNSDEEDGGDDSSDNTIYPRFLISLSALLETLQIFGISDPQSSTTATSTTEQSNSSASHAFSAPALLLDRSCTLGYAANGSPLSITLTEAGMTTTCELTTYEPDDLPADSGAAELDIPLQRDAITLKIIMRSAWLHNAIAELSSTNPTILSVSASDARSPYFALSASGGPFSESTVEFSVDKENPNSTAQEYKALSEEGSRQKRSRHAPTVAETFLVAPPSSRSSVKQSYRFSLIKKAARAMAAASKVSIRGDRQGVLSLQFMIELGESGNSGPNGRESAAPSGGSAGGNVSFVDFRFVPLLDEDGED